MLQQTQVTTVIPYFEAFLQAFPQVTDLAAAPSEQVMGLWAGLGYYSRARNLHAAAKMVAAQGGVFPDSAGALEALPGVGRSTAAAIAAFGFGAREAILDGNVKRVLCRVFAVEGDPTSTAVQKRLWSLAEAELPLAGEPAAGEKGALTGEPATEGKVALAGEPDAEGRAVLAGKPAAGGRVAPTGKPTAEARVALAADMVAYTQGMMDLGAMVCTRTKPDCAQCPVSRHCQAWQQGAVERYPTPRVRREQPVRQVNLLWLQDGDGRVLLEARPEKGLWGGLWSLPELPQVLPDLADCSGLADLSDRARTPSGVRKKGAATARLPAGVALGWQQAGRFEHVFTHFRMQATLWTPVARAGEDLPLFGVRFPAQGAGQSAMEGALSAAEGGLSTTAGTLSVAEGSLSAAEGALSVAKGASGAVDGGLSTVGGSSGASGAAEETSSVAAGLEAQGLLPEAGRQRWISAAGAEGAPLPAPILRCIRTLL